ncbi:putative endoribonuclease L-PSP [Fimicolochytrium jonesii]|uniref:putative endoribonuclease L-PSP n=1 Tax=Fimicolochytrium jonesii TaxID=1396493 RepID=UPI0022FEF6A9|nr:putative endoribonuclease L-PSP [Fimicolochytrium jonesii]KAI8817442.1 putative endoribonuclease L-PSP [Fimicolochytrium jonesii]
MSLHAVNSPRASKPRLGTSLPYSHAIVSGGFAFLTGQVGLPPNSDTIVPGGVREETRVTFENVNAILEECGCELAGVVRCEVYLTDLADFEGFNEVWTEVFGEHKPARAVMQIAKLGMGARIEIIVTARCRE